MKDTKGTFNLFVQITWLKFQSRGLQRSRVSGARALCHVTRVRGNGLAWYCVHTVPWQPAEHTRSRRNARQIHIRANEIIISQSFSFCELASISFGQHVSGTIWDRIAAVDRGLPTVGRVPWMMLSPFFELFNTYCGNTSSHLFTVITWFWLGYSLTWHCPLCVNLISHVTQ